jgi:cyclophilin family peptidyl-prolyl cis-trans isomerase
MKRKNLSGLQLAKYLVIPSVVTLLFGQYISLADASNFFGKKDNTSKRIEMTSKNSVVEMDTTKGVIKIEIFESDAPITGKNFLDLVKRGFYNGVVFHRYEPGFCIQGGDPTGTGTSGFIDPTTKRQRTIPLEVTSKLKHSEAGMVAMARSNDPNSASSQFYFTLGPASFLDGQYAVFGKVIDGLSVVKELRKGDKMTKVFVLAEAHK